jgi:phosphate transport system permease protein
MTATLQPPAPGRAGGPQPGSLVQGILPSWAPAAVLLGSLAVATAAMSPFGYSLYGIGVLGFLLTLVVITVLSRRVEGRRKGTDRLVTTLVYGAFTLAVLPLVSLVWTVLHRGLPGISTEFFTQTMRGVLGEGGGIAHAIVGTLLVTGLAALISVPIGLLTAVYLVEYGRGRLARWVTFLVDVMTGIPSIVAGLFAYALFEIFYGPGIRLGAAGSVALSVLMIPVVVRSSEEMLKLVPNELREASYALGVPRWRTIVKVVIPTAIAGIATGVTLSIARVIGETAPLLIICGLTTSMNTNLFSGRMTTLPVFAYYSYVTPGIPPEAGYQRAWSSALVLIVIVMLLNLAARVISRLFAPKTAGR